MTNNISKRYEELLESGLFSDVTFLVGEESAYDSSGRFSAHKCILGSVSPVFAKMLSEDSKAIKMPNPSSYGFKGIVKWIYTPQNSLEYDGILNKDCDGSNKWAVELCVPDMSPSIFKDVLKWMYTGEIDLSIDNVFAILHGADKYELTCLMEKCISFTKQNVETKSLCPLFCKAKQHNTSELLSWIDDRIGMNANIINASNSFLEIKDNETLKDILAIDNLDLDEIDVFKTACRWVSIRSKDKEENHEEIDLRGILGPALYSIRFPLLTPSQIVSDVLPSGLLKDQEVVDVLKCISKLHSTDLFSMKTRIRNCCRFKSKAISPISSLHHSIELRVDQPILIHGYGIYTSSSDSNNSRLAGQINLDSVDSKDVNECAKATYFSINHVQSYKISRILFDEPIEIAPESVYRASIKFDPTSLGVDSYMGKNGNAKMTLDGVEFSFIDVTDSGNETNLQKGQIPWIIFSRVL
uniref:BTB domain-containing protein n=1 Tax=Lepeophtheirus salmonis TaxID=72036 RepID=A0A0K2UJY5_LEPSM